MSDTPGSHRQSDPGTTTVSGLLSTLVPILVTSGIFVSVFLLLRRTLRRQYEPRAFLSTLRPQERSPAMPKGLFNWFGQFYQLPDTFVLNHHSMDGYLLLRFLKIATIICLVGALITFPILFPVYATGGNGQVQLNLLTMSNVPSSSPRFYATTFVGWAFFTFVWYMIARESIFYINLRQAYLLSPLYANRISSRTVLYNSLPGEMLDEAKIRRVFGKKLKNLWIPTDCKELQDLVDQRDKAAFKLEAAETKLAKLAYKARAKDMKKEDARENNNDAISSADVDGESGSIAARWVPTKKRPTHRLKPIIGKKVDTINWCRAELERLIPQITALQAKHRAGETKFLNSVFVEFYTQSQAQEAYQTTTHHLPLHMSPRYIGVNPDEVIWQNLRIKWWERIVRNILTIGFVCVLILFWTVPVALVGALSNIRSLMEIAPWLNFLNKLPTPIFGIVSSLLPSVMLAVLMALLPIILRLAAKLGGMPSRARIELRTQNFYFAFQVVQVFLVTTFTSGAAKAGSAIAQNPGMAPSLLAEALPTASNFYISYFIIQGLQISSQALLQLVGLILFRVLGKILDTTPRKMYKRWSTLSGLGWGTVMPVYSLLVVISITYSVIAPLMLAFATIGLYLFYLANRYNLLFVFNAQIDTKGLMYPRALQHTTVGLYLAMVCLIGLFGINEVPGPAILMAIYLIVSILFHITLNSALGPLMETVPTDLIAEEETLMDSLENGDASDEKTVVDQRESLGHGAAPHKKPNLFTKWLRPDRYTDYHTLRRLVPLDFAKIGYSPEHERNAYYNPCIASDTPLLWIPKDAMGISRQEIHHTSRVIPITDDGASFDDEGKITWNQESPPPVYQEKIYW